VAISRSSSPFQGPPFAAEEKRLNAQIASLEDEAARLEDRALEKVQAAERFDQVSELLTSLDLESIWEHATDAERRTLVEDLVDSVHIYPDHLSVQVAGAPPIVVTLAEVGLRAGTKPVVGYRQNPVGQGIRQRLDDHFPRCCSRFPTLLLPQPILKIPWSRRRMA